MGALTCTLPSARTRKLRLRTRLRSVSTAISLPPARTMMHFMLPLYTPARPVSRVWRRGRLHLGVFKGHCPLTPRGALRPSTSCLYIILLRRKRLHRFLRSNFIKV